MGSGSALHTAKIENAAARNRESGFGRGYEDMKKIMKKAGWTIVSLLPVLLFYGIQLGVAFVCMAVMGVMAMLQSGGDMDAAELTILITRQYMENIIPVLIVSQIIAAAVFGLWYYLAWGKRKRPEGTERPGINKILLILVLGLAAQFAISGLLTLVELIFPGALSEYEELMEMAGLGETTILTLLSTVILAPLSEELTCRGIIYRLAGKISPGFWVANIVQALAFGILHGNLIQGAYAFGLGIILGLVYRQFQNIWLCMLLHASMNFSSVLVGPFYSLFPESAGVAVVIVTMLVAAALGAFCMKGILRRQSDPDQ